MQKIKFNIKTPNSVNQIHQSFISKGFELVLVGGAVRDSLLGIEPKDYDLATNATPDEVINILQDQPFVNNIIETGKAFAVINVLVDGEEFEIATFRKEGNYIDGRRPTSVDFATMQEDSQRRDLTLNALYYDISTQEVIDFVGGVEDLKNSVIRTVGKAKDRFNEDKLRVLRAIRFAARFDADLDQEILNKIENGVDLSQISKERIRDEFLKGIKTSFSVTSFLNLLGKLKMFDIIFEGIEDIGSYIESRNPSIVIAFLLNCAFPTRKQLLELKYTDKEVKEILFLIDFINFFNSDSAYDFKRSQVRNNISNELIKEAMSFLKLTPEIKKRVEAFLQFELSVDGSSIMEKYNLKGAAIGEKIAEIENKNFLNVLDGVMKG